MFAGDHMAHAMAQSRLLAFIEEMTLEEIDFLFECAEMPELSEDPVSLDVMKIKLRAVVISGAIDPRMVEIIE